MREVKGLAPCGKSLSHKGGGGKIFPPGKVGSFLNPWTLANSPKGRLLEDACPPDAYVRAREWRKAALGGQSEVDAPGTSVFLGECVRRRGTRSSQRRRSLRQGECYDFATIDNWTGRNLKVALIEKISESIGGREYVLMREESKKKKTFSEGREGGNLFRVSPRRKSSVRASRRNRDFRIPTVHPVISRGGGRNKWKTWSPHSIKRHCQRRGLLPKDLTKIIERLRPSEANIRKKKMFPKSLEKSRGTEVNERFTRGLQRREEQINEENWKKAFSSWPVALTKRAQEKKKIV